ncbi:MAG: hypothetical protein AB8I80_16555, partial [Anaerolineae bacterium]
MQAIELETDIDDNHEIHLKLPGNIKAHKARVLVLIDEGASDSHGLRTFGQFPGAVTMSEDFDAPLPEDFW